MTTACQQTILDYQAAAQERQQQQLPALVLTAMQTADIIKELCEDKPFMDREFLLNLIINNVPPGVDEASYVKAAFLTQVASGEICFDWLTAESAIQLLGTMIGGYNVNSLVMLIKQTDNQDLAKAAAKQLKKTLLVYDSFNDITQLSSEGNAYATEILQSWADAQWFTDKPEIPQIKKVIAFKVAGETNTDDLSPAVDAWSRPDIPLHAKAMYKNPRPGIDNALQQIDDLKKHNLPLALIGDVLGTGSSRKSATNSVQWHMGDDIPFVPNKRTGGICIGGKIAPIFFNTMQDAGAIPIECEVDKINMGDVIVIKPYEGKIESESGQVLSTFELSTEALNQARAGGRINLIIGRTLAQNAAKALNTTSYFNKQLETEQANQGPQAYTLAQKMVGKACGRTGVKAGEYCEPLMTTVGSQDTTGPMTRDELKELACLGFGADLVMQSFCHTVAYPKPVDVETQKTLPDFIRNRGGVSLQPGDGIIHSWLNRMLLPDTVGTGADSHTRFPIGISFPGGSGLVAFSATMGIMPLDMPESVLVKFSGEMQPGITLRDLVNAIPYTAIQKGLLTVETKGKKNIFSGRILEIEGLPNLKIEQAFEFADASAERSASGCTVALDEAPVIEYLKSNIVMLRWMIDNGYQSAKSLERRAQAMEKWLENPKLMKADQGAEYTAVIEVNMNEITEPLLACPNDPDDIKKLSDVENSKIDEVFIGSCMTNIGHFRAAAKMLTQAGDTNGKLWICPPTKMDQEQLTKEGVYKTFQDMGARLEVPGCSLCMGNQARVEENASVVSTSTRNFPNRLGKGANVYLASSEIAALSAVLGRLPTNAEYQAQMSTIDSMASEIYRYLNFNEINSFVESSQRISNQNIVS